MHHIYHKTNQNHSLQLKNTLKFLQKRKSQGAVHENLGTRLCRPATLSYEPAWQVGDRKNAF